MDNIDKPGDNSSNKQLSQGSCVASPNTATLDPNWQTTKLTIRDRNAVLFNNSLMSDITFIVGPSGHQQVIRAHKFILASGSPVFFAMFFGGLSECKQEIELPDVEPRAFLTLLKYLYCDEIQLEADTALPTLYVAKKYIVPHLSKKCVNFLAASLSAENACQNLIELQLNEEPDLMQRCLDIIDEEAEMVLKSDGFLDLDVSTLESVLSRQTLNCKEINVFKAAIAWAQVQCIRKEMEPTPNNQRAMLSNAIYQIRFPTMTSEEFANSVAQSCILTLQENNDIFLFLNAANKPQLSYPIQPRAIHGKEQIYEQEFNSVPRHYITFHHEQHCATTIDFCVDRTISLIGFLLFNPHHDPFKYKFNIQLSRGPRVLAENDTHLDSDGNSKTTFYVYFIKPIVIEPKCFYTAVVSALKDGFDKVEINGLLGAWR